MKKLPEDPIAERPTCISPVPLPKPSKGPSKPPITKLPPLDEPTPIDLDKMSRKPEILDGSYIKTQEQAIEYMLKGASQLHQAPANRSEDLCTAIRQYISKIPLDTWYWIYKESTAGMEFIQEIQEHGIYVANSIKALAKFSQSEGVPVWLEDVVNEFFAASI